MSCLTGGDMIYGNCRRRHESSSWFWKSLPQTPRQESSCCPLFFLLQTKRSGQFAALCSHELQKEHLFFLFGCNSSADCNRLLFARPLVVDLGGSLGTPAIGVDHPEPGVAVAAELAAIGPVVVGGMWPGCAVLRLCGGAGPAMGRAVTFFSWSCWND